MMMHFLYIQQNALHNTVYIDTKKQVNVNCSTEIILNTNHEVINFQFPCGMNLLRDSG